MRAAGDGPGGSGEVECDDGEDEPGGVGVEPAGWQVGEGGSLEVGEDLLDDRVASSTRSGRTDGYSGTAKAGPTSAGSTGRRSSGTEW